MTLVSHSPINPLQKAIVARLKGGAALVTLLGGRPAIYDQPPEGEAYPYVRVGDHLSIPDNDLSSFGRQSTETLHVWTRVRGNATGQEIAAAVNALLDHQSDALSALLASDGQRCVSIRNEFDQALTDPDPEIRHHVLRFRVITAQQS